MRTAMDRASRPSGALDGLTALRFCAALLVMRSPL